MVEVLSSMKRGMDGDGGMYDTKLDLVWRKVVLGQCLPVHYLR
jgi:hypothetical protein